MAANITLTNTQTEARLPRLAKMLLQLLFTNTQTGSHTHIQSG